MPPVQTPAAARSTAWRRHAGLPQVGAARPLLFVIVIDAAGGGLFLPFSLLYFHVVAGLSIVQAGAGITVATLASLPLTPLAGVLMHRWSARKIAIAAYALRALGFVGYLLVTSVPALVVAAFLTATGSTWYWTANGALVSQAAAPGEKDRWFGLQRAVKNAGLGFGALIASLIIEASGQVGYRLVVILTASAFLSAAVLLSTLRLPAPGPPARNGHSATSVKENQEERRSENSGIRAVARDRPYLGFLAGNSILVLFGFVLNVAIPVYVVEILRSPTVLVGVVFTLNGALIAVAQTPIMARLEHRGRIRRLQLGTGLWVVSFAMLLALRLAPSAVVTVMLLAAMVIFTLAEIVCAPTADALAVHAAPPASLGHYLAAYQLSWGLAIAVAPSLYTAMLAWNPDALWLALIAVGLALIVGGNALRARLPG